MLHKSEDVFILLLLFIPLVAILGGIVAGILKVVGQQRLMELAQRERIAAIERGMDPNKLPAAAAGGDPSMMSNPWLSPAERARRLHQGLLIGGIVTLAVGIGIMTLFFVTEDDGNAWAIGILPEAIGLALLLCAWLVRPRGTGNGFGHGAAPGPGADRP